MASSSTSIHDLPPEIVFNILKRLELRDLERLRQSCSFLTQILSDRTFKFAKITDETKRFVREFLDVHSEKLQVRINLNSSAVFEILHRMSCLSILELDGVFVDSEGFNRHNLPRTLQEVSFVDCRFDRPTMLLQDIVINSMAFRQLFKDGKWNQNVRLSHFAFIHFRNCEVKLRLLKKLKIGNTKQDHKDLTDSLDLWPELPSPDYLDEGSPSHYSCIKQSLNARDSILYEEMEQHCLTKANLAMRLLENSLAGHLCQVKDNNQCKCEAPRMLEFYGGAGVVEIKVGGDENNNREGCSKHPLSWKADLHPDLRTY